MTVHGMLKKLGAKDRVTISNPVQTLQFDEGNGRAIFEVLKGLEGVDQVRRGKTFVSWANHVGDYRHKVRLGDYIVLDRHYETDENGEPGPWKYYAYAVDETTHEEHFIPVPRKRKK